jgi:uncharacterized protein DUF4160
MSTAPVSIESLRCQRSYEAGRIGCSSIRVPRHVHVEHDANIAKFWLDPVRLAHSGGFARAEIKRVETLVSEHAAQLRQAWDEYFTE